MKEKTVIIKSALDARQVAFFVQTAGKFQSDIKIAIENKKVSAKSIMGIIALEMAEGCLLYTSCFGGVIMHFFGFYYESVWKLMLFFILSGLVGLPLELVAKGVPKALLAFNKISVGFARGIFFILDVLSTMVSMIVVDYFIESVSATLRSVVVIAVIIAILSVKDIGKPKKENVEL